MNNMEEGSNQCPVIRQINQKLYMNQMGIKARYDLSRIKDKLKGRANMFERATKGSISMDKDLMKHNRTFMKADFGYFTNMNIESSKHVKDISEKLGNHYRNYLLNTPQKIKIKSKLPKFNFGETLANTSNGFSTFSNNNFRSTKSSNFNTTKYKFKSNKPSQSEVSLPEIKVLDYQFGKTGGKKNFYLQTKLNKQKLINVQLYECFTDLENSKAKIDKKFEERIEQLKNMKVDW
jgi:hypothetical protein